jgi:hypothetical protein
MDIFIDENYTIPTITSIGRRFDSNDLVSGAVNRAPSRLHEFHLQTFATFSIGQFGNVRDSELLGLVVDLAWCAIVAETMPRYQIHRYYSPSQEGYWACADLLALKALFQTRICIESLLFLHRCLQEGEGFDTKPIRLETKRCWHGLARAERLFYRTNLNMPNDAFYVESVKPTWSFLTSTYYL